MQTKNIISDPDNFNVANVKIHKFNKKLFVVVFSIFAVLALSLICGCSQSNLKTTISNGREVQTSYNTEQTPNGMSHFDGYTLNQMTVLSRHNLRSPIQGSNSKLNQITPHQWFKWTSKSSELSMKGAEEEEMFGQYFKKYLENEGFIPENWVPNGNEAYVYANSYQRTIATAQNFIAGMLPVGGVNVNHKYQVGGKDTTFTTDMLFYTPKWEATARAELNELRENGGIDAYLSELQSSLDVLNKTLDFKDSQYAQEHNTTALGLDGAGVTFKKGTSGEVELNEELGLANSASDALILQYFEEEDDKLAGFDTALSYDEWEKISKICDYRQHTNFAIHAIGINIGHNMLVELQKNMNQQDRKFTFLCGHDSTINAVLGAMRVKDYFLPNQISKQVPIGSKLVINRYTDDKTGEQYIRACMVYETVDQIRHRDTLNLDNPPMEYQLEFSDLQANENGMYKAADFEARMQTAIDEFTTLQ